MLKSLQRSKRSETDCSDKIAEKAVSYALNKASGVAALSDENNQIECINFKKIKGGKPFDHKQKWFNDILIEIGQKR